MKCVLSSCHPGVKGVIDTTLAAASPQPFAIAHDCYTSASASSSISTSSPSPSRSNDSIIVPPSFNRHATLRPSRPLTARDISAVPRIATRRPRLIGVCTDSSCRADHKTFGQCGLCKGPVYLCNLHVHPSTAASLPASNLLERVGLRIPQAVAHDTLNHCSRPWL